MNINYKKEYTYLHDIEKFKRFIKELENIFNEFDLKVNLLDNDGMFMTQDHSNGVSEVVETTGWGWGRTSHTRHIESVTTSLKDNLVLCFIPKHNPMRKMYVFTTKWKFGEYNISKEILNYCLNERLGKIEDKLRKNEIISRIHKELEKFKYNLDEEMTPLGVDCTFLDER